MCALLWMLLAVGCGGEPSGSAATGAAAATTATSAAVSMTTEDAPAGPTQVSGRALPLFAQSPNDAAIGRAAPVVLGTDLLTGAEVRIEAQGRPLVVAFYAHWCPHCQAEVTALTEWLATNELPAGVDFYALSVLEDPSRGNHPPAQWLRDEGWAHPVVADTTRGSAVEAFGLASVPYLVAVDADGAVALRHAGSVAPQDLAALFSALLESAA